MEARRAGGSFHVGGKVLSPIHNADMEETAELMEKISRPPEETSYPAARKSRHPQTLQKRLMVTFRTVYYYSLGQQCRS